MPSKEDSPVPSTDVSQNRSDAEPVAVTIGMPTYNAEDRILRSIDSLLAQNFSDFELIISDNASTDNTQQVCKKAAASDARIKYIRQPENLGQLGNFNYVIQAASGRYFMWAHDDDIYDARFISTLKPILDQNPDVGYVMSTINRVDENGNTVGYDRWTNTDDPGNMSKLRHALTVANGFSNRKRYHLFMFSLFRTPLIQAASPYGRYEVAHPDRLFMTQLALASAARFVDAPYYIRTVHQESMNQRLPDETPNARINSDPWGYTRTVLALVPYLLRSRIIRRSEKLTVPILFIAMAYSYRHHLYQGNSPLVKIISVPYRKVRRIGAILLRRKSNTPPLG
jgi:glycosyltransferase involved in cell wall biosynthesis